MNELMVVAGTRPEIIKMAPVIRALQGHGVPFIFVYCGQHYDYKMSRQFINELGLPRPNLSYKVRAYSPAVQTGRIMCFLERTIKKYKPRKMLVEGDTNSVLASAIAAVKQNVQVGHIEAGLRSYDLRMPEEHNRRLVDHLSTYLFAPTETAKTNLERENVWGKAYVTGNTVIDAVTQHLPIAQQKSTIMEKIRYDSFALATAHRAENVDDPKTLKNIIEAYAEAPIPIVYPVHPRTRKRLVQNGMWRKLKESRNVQLLPPLGYFDFLILMKNCMFIITDSGGIQEEATAPPIRKRVIVTRLSTERPEAVEAGFARVTGVEKHTILSAIKETLTEKVTLPAESPYGDGKAAEQITAILKDCSHL